MKRLNKCRTIAKFDEKVLAMVTGQTASTSSETQSTHHQKNLPLETSTTNQKSENESDKKTESESKKRE